MTPKHGSSTWRSLARGAITRASGRGAGVTTGVIHARARTNADTVLLAFVVASTPALVIGVWNAGRQLLPELAASGTWRADLLTIANLPLSSDNAWSCLIAGLTLAAPLIFVALAVALFWAVLFATVRNRTIDSGWLLTGWLYALLLPPDLSLVIAALGMSFAAVFGQHIFGGTGRYIASPALLGALFVQFAYPAAFEPTSAWPWLAAAAPDTGTGPAGGGVEPGGYWWPAFAGADPGRLATPSVFACFLGAALLVRARIASLRTIAGSLAGLAAGVALANLIGASPAAAVPLHWHLAAGSFGFCVAFIATDPTTLPVTRFARWAHGLLFGLMVVAIRVLDPSHPDGTLFALLIATLLVPLLDHFVLRRQMSRSDGRLVLKP